MTPRRRLSGRPPSTGSWRRSAAVKPFWRQYTSEPSEERRAAPRGRDLAEGRDSTVSPHRVAAPHEDAHGVPRDVGLEERGVRLAAGNRRDEEDGSSSGVEELVL